MAARILAIRSVPAQCSRTPGLNGHLDRTIPDADVVRIERLRGRTAQNPTVADIERRSVQRADDPCAAQPAFRHARLGVRTDAGECMEPRRAVTDHDLATRHLAARHAADRELADVNHPLVSVGIHVS